MKVSYSVRKAFAESGQTIFSHKIEFFKVLGVLLLTCLIPQLGGLIFPFLGLSLCQMFKQKSDGETISFVEAVKKIATLKNLINVGILLLIGVAIGFIFNYGLMLLLLNSLAQDQLFQSFWPLLENRYFLSIIPLYFLLCYLLFHYTILYMAGLLDNYSPFKALQKSYKLTSLKLMIFLIAKMFITFIPFFVYSGSFIFFGSFIRSASATFHFFAIAIPVGVLLFFFYIPFMFARHIGALVNLYVQNKNS